MLEKKNLYKPKLDTKKVDEARNELLMANLTHRDKKNFDVSESYDPSGHFQHLVEEEDLLK